jgi:hypothetical protein
MPSNDLICYQFGRDRLEAGDAKDFLSGFSEHRVPVGRQEFHQLLSWNSLAMTAKK